MMSMEGLEIQLAQTSPVPDAPQGGGGGLGFFLPLIAMFLLLYALVIRPQSRQQKEQKKMLSQLQRGDAIVTSGGLHGRITGISDEVLTVEIAERVRVKISRSAVAARTPVGEQKEKKETKREPKEKSA
jgi:preprotein translocase subunit YajC